MVQKDSYGTPLDFYQELDKRFHFYLDPCAWPTNALNTPQFFTEVDDGLSLDWNPGPVFTNPPYSKMPLWSKKAYEESLKGNLVVGLVRHDTSTRWWNNWIKGKAWIEPIPYRIRFVGGDGAYNFPSTLVIWHGMFQEA